MTLWKTEHDQGVSKQQGSGWYLDLAALIGIASAPGFLFAWLIPLPFIPPMICMVSLVIASSFALFAHYTGANRRSAEVTAWDVAGIFTLVWVGAGLASDPKHLVQLFEILARGS